MKKFYIIGAMVIVIMVLIYAGHKTSSPKYSEKPSPKNQVAIVASNGSSQNSATVETKQDPEDVVPGIYPNPINNNATAEGFKLSSLMVENNTDALGNAVNDHLQFTLQNLTNKDISNFEVYYTITDTTNNKKEGYYKKLDNFTLKANSSQDVHFDGQPGYGHYTDNPHNLYHTSSDKLQFTVEVSAPGYKIESADVAKDAGGAETKD